MKAKRAYQESALSRDVRKTLNLMLPRNSIAFKVPNENEDELTRKIKAGEGVLSGVPDWCIIQALDDPWQAFGGPGFCRVVMPELKAKNRTPTDDQKRVMAHLRERCNVVTGPCWTLDDVLALCEAGGIRLKGRIV